MKRQIASFFLFFLAALTACKSSDIRNSLDEIDSYVDADPQAALAAIDGLDMSGVKAESIKAHYSLLHSKALDKCYIDTTDVSVIMDAVNYYSKHGDPDQKMQSYYYLGRIHGNAGRYTESILALTQALEDGQTSFDDKYKGRVYIAMADAYNRNYNVVEEGRCVDEALRYFEASGDSSLIRGATYRKAISCMNLKEYDQSDSLFQSLLAIPDLRQSLKAKSLYHYAYLLALRDVSDYQRTKSLFEDAIKAGANLTKESAAAYAYTLWCCGNETESEALFKALEQQDSTITGIIASWMGKIKKKEGLYQEAYEYLNDAMTYAAEVEEQVLRQSLSITQRDYYLSLAAQQKAKADNNKLISVLISMTSFSLILLLIGIGLFIIKRYRERHLHVLSDLEYIKEKVAAIQKTADDKIDNLQTKIFGMFRERFQEYAKIYETYDRNIVSGVKGIAAYNHIQEIFKVIKGEEETEHRFEKIIDKETNGIITIFRKDYPNLTEIEYQLFCYYVVGYDTKTISILLSEKTPDALYMRKSRLKSKIEASDVKDKEKYLKYF
ncbi:MAG: hypothetical protein IKN88_00785 [Bacteroidales bacterium]|nr:hypothetical protein [Bacteroidales bacterium]